MHRKKKKKIMIKEVIIAKVIGMTKYTFIQVKL